MQKVLNFMVGALAGALVGSALALLLAPSSGKATRSDIHNYASQMKDEIELAAHTRRAELQEQLAHLRGEIVSE
jgi:gas vesicle protein